MYVVVCFFKRGGSIYRTLKGFIYFFVCDYSDATFFSLLEHGANVRLKCVCVQYTGRKEGMDYFSHSFLVFRFFVFLSNRPMTNDWQLPVYAALLAAVCGKKLIQRRLFFFFCFFFCFRVPPHVVNFQPVGVVSFFIRKRKKTGSIYNDRKSVGTLAFVIPTGSL